MSFDLSRWFVATMPRQFEKAKRMVDGHDIEVWSGERLVIRMSPANKI